MYLFYTVDQDITSTPFSLIWQKFHATHFTFNSAAGYVCTNSYGPPVYSTLTTRDTLH